MVKKGLKYRGVVVEKGLNRGVWLGDSLIVEGKEGGHCQTRQFSMLHL